MKTFLIAAACFAVAVAGPSRFIIPSPGGPAPVVVEGEYEPISVGPAIIEGDYQPISVGPAIVEGDYEPISVGPAIVEGDYEPISVGPAIVEGDYQPISVGPAIVNPVIPSPVFPSPANSPLVQITINVNTDSVSPVTIDNAPVIVGPEVDPTPVDFVDNEEVEPSPVIVVDEVEVPEPVLIAPIDTAPVVNVPDILN